MATLDETQRRDAPDRGGDIELGALWASILKRKYWVIVPTLLTIGAAAAAVTIMEPRYTSEARILLEVRETPFTRPIADRETGGSTTGSFDAEAVQSQVQVITSFDLSRAAIKKLDLIGNAEFDPAEAPLGVLGRFMVLLGMQKGPADRAPENRVLENYYSRLNVFPVGKSRVVAVEFTSRDPVLAARAANEVASLYLETVRTAKIETARSAGSWLSSAIDPLRAKVKEAEARVEAFRSEIGLFSGSSTATIVQQQLAEASTQLSQAREAKATLEARLKLVREMVQSGRIFELSEVANNETIRRLIEQRGALRAQIARDLRTLLPGHPQITSLRAQLTDVEAQVRTAADRLIRSIENDARIAAGRVDSLTAELDEKKKGSARANSDEVQLRALEREARVLREQLEAYLAKQRDALARDAENATPADARVISTAIVPSKPSFPKKLPIVLIAGFAAFGLAGALVVAREILAGREPSPESPTAASTAASTVPVAAVSVAPGEVEKPLVAAAPQSGPDFSGAAAGRPNADKPLLAEVAARVAAEPRRDGALRILVVAQDGAAEEVPVGLARALAESGRAVLIDLLKSAAGEQQAGLTDLVAGKASFMEAIRRDPGSRLHIIGIGHHDPRALTSARPTLAMVTDALAETYDSLVLACRASLDDETVSAIAAAADSVILVAGGDEPDKETGASFIRFEALSGREPYVVMLGSAGDEKAAA